MTDSFANDQLSAYLDGELSEVEAAELERQLARDPELRSELEQLRAAVELLRTHGPVQAPVGFYGDILRAVEEEPMPGGWWRWLLRPFGMPIQGLAVAAVGLVVLGIALNSGGLLTGGGDPSPADSKAATKAGAAVGDAKAKDAPGVAEEKDAPVAQADAGDLGEAAEGRAEEAPATKSSSAVSKKKEAIAKAMPKSASKAPGDEKMSLEATTGTSSGTDAEGEAGAGTVSTSTVASTSKTAEKKSELSNRTVAYVLDTRDTEALYKLQRLVSRHGGALVGPNGQALTAYDLTQGAPQTYTVRVPRSRLSGFVADLEALGRAREVGSAASSEYFTADNATVQLTVAFTGGEAEQKQAAPTKE